MVIEILNIGGKMVTHFIIPIKGDGACLFRSLSYLMYGNEDMECEVREKIVQYVKEYWDEFSGFTDDGCGDNYSTLEEYCAHMILLSTYGTI